MCERVLIYQKYKSVHRGKAYKLLLILQLIITLQKNNKLRSQILQRLVMGQIV